MPTKPNLPDGYLGAQPTFSKLGLNTFSHMDAEFKTDCNEIEIKLKFTEPVKMTHQLINARTNEDVSQYVFSQTLFGNINFKIAFPCSDYYKFQLFALPENEQKSSLPNVFNYLINCDKALTPVFAFPKQYAKWKEGCVLKQPLCLHKDMCLSNVPFHVSVPHAKAVAVVADDEWFHLEKKGNHFEGTFDLTPFKGKDTKVTVNANVEDDESKYTTLLEYRV